MKLRLLANSIRLRLSDDDAIQLAKNGYVEASTQFAPGQTLTYSIHGTDRHEPRVEFVDGRIRVDLHSDELARLVSDSSFSLSTKQPLGGNEILEILIERDLECPDRQ